MNYSNPLYAQRREGRPVPIAIGIDGVSQREGQVNHHVNNGIACGPGCTFIRLQALGAAMHKPTLGRYLFPSLMQQIGKFFYTLVED